MRKIVSALLAIVLVVTLVPLGAVQHSTAATVTPATPATYFLPDINSLRETAKLQINDPSGVDSTNKSTFLSRTNAYSTISNTIDIAGTFAGVSSDNMMYRIEQLNVAKSPQVGWVPDTTHFTVGTVQADQGSTNNRFTADNLQLFPGMNRITFTGTQGSMERSDSFYVLYDQIPYLQSLQIVQGANNINLNEGAQAVVTTSALLLQGVAKNSTQLSVTVNGGSPARTSILDDGTFYTPSLPLQPGDNTLVLNFTNGTDSINLERHVFYYDAKHPFTSVVLDPTTDGDPTTGTQILNATPTVTEPADDDERIDDLLISMIVPYGPNDFSGHSQYSFTSSDSTAVYGSIPGANASIPGSNTTVRSEEVIPGPDGITPAYKLVTFDLTNLYPYAMTSGTFNTNQYVSFSINYTTGNGTDVFTAAFDGSFKYLPDQKVITNIQYLPGYDGSTNLSNVDKLPLNGAEVAGSDFYILVTTDKAFTDLAGIDKVTASYLPMGSSLNLGTGPVISPGSSGAGANQAVFKVTGFNNGQQKVQFKLAGSSDTYVVDISYVQKSYIYVENLYDGQSYHFDSSVTNSTLNQITVNGQFRGFNGLDKNTIQFFVNGNQYPVYVDGTLTTGSSSTALSGGRLDLSSNDYSFTAPLAISTEGPLVAGENNIVIKGSNISGGIKQDVTKEVKIYLIDDNIATITQFMPTLPTGRVALSKTDVSTYTAAELANIFSVSPEFQNKDGIYETSQTSFDLVVQGTGASSVNINIGSDTFLPTQAIDDSNARRSGTLTYNNAQYPFEIVGNRKSFILRIQGIPFTAPGSVVFNLELRNTTGAKSTQRLEIKRVVAPYRILSPVPTVGDQIIVNKNFVRFDIEAEGATDVIINKVSATKRPDLDNRFTYDYVGLKPDKVTAIPIQIVSGGTTTKVTVNVYYSSTVQVDSQYMQKMGSKFTVFNKGLQLSFPKNTVLKAATPNSQQVTKIYTDTNLLFGIADPDDGVVERRNDYGNIIGVNNDARSEKGNSPIVLRNDLIVRYANNSNTANFTPISPTYWISGGEGELGNSGSVTYKPATNGLPPYSIEGNFTEFQPERKVVPTARGELTLAFDENVVDEIGYTVTVFRYTDKGVWENVGGEADVKKHTITVPFDEFGYYRVMKLRMSYTDITGHPWARNILNGLYAKGIMNPLRSDEFGSDDKTTRGEFATLLVKGLNLPLNYSGKATFMDIQSGTSTTTWDYEHIETAARAGIVTGLSDGYFGAGMPITRQDAAVMIARALKLKLATNDSKLDANLAKAFLDSGSIQYYAKPAIDAVNKAKIMTGSPTTIQGQKKVQYLFSPTANMTRAEAGKVVVELLKKSTNIFPKTLS